MIVGLIKQEKVKQRDSHVSSCIHGLCGGLEHLKIETRLIDERFESVMGEFVIVTLKVCRLYSM
jgi:hypothetical protein